MSTTSFVNQVGKQAGRQASEQASYHVQRRHQLQLLEQLSKAVQLGIKSVISSMENQLCMPWRMVRYTGIILTAAATTQIALLAESVAVAGACLPKRYVMLQAEQPDTETNRE